MEDTIIETTLEHYVRHLPKGTKTLNDHRRFAESLKMGLAIYSGTPSSSQKNKQLLVPTIDVIKRLAEMENSRVKIFYSLRDTVIEMCEQSATTLREPTEKNQRALQVKKSTLDVMFKRFQTRISGLQKELDQMEENAHPLPQKAATLTSASLVAQAIYSQKELTVIEQEKKTGEHSRTSSAKSSLHLELTNLLFRPDHVQHVLEETGGFLSPLANYTLMGSFGSFSNQGTVHKAKLVGSNDENVVALKVEHLTSRISRDIISEGIVHNNIKPRNILFQNGIVKICNFGKAQNLAKFDYAKRGTLRCLAPQTAKTMIKGNNTNKELTTAVDIGALGVTLYELLEGKLPYSKVNDRVILDNIASQNAVLSLNDGYYTTSAENIFTA
ncbi:hypothetical protein TYRP_015883 [Tyrophagus putrescentiae]|nr:hypothetical protein TYRP_015883 [Tyrophagus putrescentiae]